MEQMHQKLKAYIEEYSLEAEHLVFTDSCHTVEEAALAVNGSVEEIVKNICMIDADNRMIVAIVKGEDRASTSRVAKAVQIERPRLADGDEVLELTGFPIGGVPSFGFEAIFLIDAKVMELDAVYTGGGSAQALVRTTPEQLLQANQGTVARIRK